MSTRSRGAGRRRFIQGAAKGAAGLLASDLIGRGFSLAGPHPANGRLARKVIVLGIDGLDPVLLERFIARGEMPSFQRLVRSGHFGRLGTTMPPQSPVAWSSFITGCNPGGHGIFDFIHRDPATFTPYLSTSSSSGSTKTIDVGNWSIPLRGGKIELLRRGPTFWTTLEEHGIPTSLIKLPANYPVEVGSSRQISGMGTPDLLGTYGTFTYYSDRRVPGAEKFSGGRVVDVRLVDHVLKVDLEGPRNPMRTDGSKTAVPLTVYRDPTEPVLRLNVQGTELVLRQGEFSEWVPIKFELMPLFAGIGGMIRFYAQEVHPHFRLYVSPINVDPLDPELPICHPSGYSRELSQAVGRFYTQGFPEDTKALSNEIFSDDEFLRQSRIVLDERLRLFDHEFSRFHEGLFFFYFSSVDQNTHMMWRCMDPTHPLYDPRASREAKQAVYYFYQKLDGVLRRIQSTLDGDSVLMLLSDHGFAPFRREFNLSTWLVDNGYTVLTDPSRMHEGEFYRYVDWRRTKAYALGLNGLYVNLQGRDFRGSVPPPEAELVKREIMAKLAAVRDPATGQRVITEAYDSRRIYSGPYMALAPDIVVGYQSGYRISDDAVLGKFPQGLVADRKDKWAADHCMDPAIVPGTLLASREVRHPAPGLWDLAPSILQAFGLPVPREMDGRPIFAA